MKARSPWRLAALVAALLSETAACTGAVGDAGSGANEPSAAAGNPAGAGQPGAPGSGNTPGAGATGPDPQLTQVIIGAPVPESAGELVMRRLTYREYDHMLADLVGDVSAPAEGASAWSPDVTGETGFIAPTSITDYHVIHYNQTADLVAETAVAALGAGKRTGAMSIPCRNPVGPAAETTCATQFVVDFGLRAYRRPLAAVEQTDLLTLFSEVRGYGLSFGESIAALVKAMLQSPNFIYHWEIGPTKPVVGPDGLAPLSPFQIASRLAESLWETTPDDALLTAAQAGQLSTPAQVAQQASRMMADPRASQALFNFHSQLLLQAGSRITDISQLTKVSPLFTPSAAQGVQTEFTQFLGSVYSTGDGTLSTLLTAPYTYVNHDLAAIYGVTGPATGFAKVALDPRQRAGILTQTAFLAANAAPDADNPVYRGIDIYTKVLCGTMSPPPPNVPTVTFKAGMGTTRQQYEVHAGAACARGCHTIFDPPGFAFENYDAVGTFRTNESGVPVDPTGSFLTPGGKTISFTNGVDLSKQLAESSEVQACFDRQWTRYMLARFETAAEAGSMAVAYQTARASAGFSLRDMLIKLVSSKAFMYRRPSAGEML